LLLYVFIFCFFLHLFSSFFLSLSPILLILLHTFLHSFPLFLWFSSLLYFLISLFLHFILPSFVSVLPQYFVFLSVLSSFQYLFLHVAAPTRLISSVMMLVAFKKTLDRIPVSSEVPKVNPNAAL